MTRLVHNVQKKQHKERSQVALRQKYGFLEKKKDYRLRAADYHKKQAALKALKEQAANYNPDEYYHAMTRRRTDDKGILLSEPEAELLSVDQVKLLKLQDVNYVRTMRLHEAKRIAAEKQQVMLQASGKHTVFVDLAEEQRKFDAAKYFDTDASLVERRQNRLRLDQLELNKGVVAQTLLADTRKQQQKEKLAHLRQLKLRLERERQLKEVEQRMDLEREMLKKGAKKKIVEADGTTRFQWLQIRKR